MEYVLFLRKNPYLQCISAYSLTSHSLLSFSSWKSIILTASPCKNLPFIKPPSWNWLHTHTRQWDSFERSWLLTTDMHRLWVVFFSRSKGLGLKSVGEERKEEEDVRTSSNCLQFRPLGHGGRGWTEMEKLLFCISPNKKWLHLPELARSGGGNEWCETTQTLSCIYCFLMQEGVCELFCTVMY